MSGMKDKIKGHFKDGYGDARGDDRLKAEGKLDKFSGAVKDKTDDLVDGARDAVTDKGDKVDTHRTDRM